MTVSYQYDVASSASGGFIRLLFRWRGSVWKVVYREMLIFTVCYILLTILYQFVLADSQQRIFERIVYFCSTFMDLIPLSFMLGFYVSFIAARWWSQFTAIPWPDKLMNIVAMYIPGLDESSRVVRRTLMRYLNLSLVLVLRSISMAVKRRFPTKEHLIEAGFMTKTELEMFQSVPSTEFNTFWIPCTWFINVLREARQECRITDSNGLKLIMEELNEFRSKCGLLWGYDWISIPLVYTQVVTMATYAFYVACMFGRQNVNVITEKSSSPEVHRYDYYIPIFTILQLMFYMGLLKVAEQLINPFGDDDEDFELNWIIDRHMKVRIIDFIFITCQIITCLHDYGIPGDIK
ncbi:bestrophin-2-like, partial [Stegodyphus dumicola]